MEKFVYKTQYGDYENCFFQVGKYTSGNIAISIVSENDGPITHCTTSSNLKYPDNTIAVKYWSENEGMEEFLIKMGIIESEPCDMDVTLPMTPSIYKLTEKGLKIVKEQLEEKP